MQSCFYSSLLQEQWDWQTLLMQPQAAQLEAPALIFIAAPQFHELWLPPLMEILGICLQLLSMRWHVQWLLWPGCLLAVLGAIPQKDITLAAGCVLAAAGLAWSYGKKP